MRPAEPHPTVLNIQEQALRTNQGRIPTPLQLIEAADAQAQAMAQQQLAQQQQAAAAQVGCPCLSSTPTGLQRITTPKPLRP